MSEEAAKQLMAELQQVFYGLARPRLDRIYRIDFYDKTDYLTLLAKKNRWQDMPIDVLEEIASSLTLMTSEGFRFYLAACLWAELSSPKALDSAYFSVMAARDHNLVSEFGLSPEEDATVRRCLELMESREWKK